MKFFSAGVVLTKLMGLSHFFWCPFFFGGGPIFLWGVCNFCLCINFLFAVKEKVYMGTNYFRGKLCQFFLGPALCFFDMC